MPCGPELGAVAFCRRSRIPADVDDCQRECGDVSSVAAAIAAGVDGLPSGPEPHRRASGKVHRPPPGARRSAEAGHPVHRVSDRMWLTQRLRDPDVTPCASGGLGRWVGTIERHPSSAPGATSRVCRHPASCHESWWSALVVTGKLGDDPQTVLKRAHGGLTATGSGGLLGSKGGDMPHEA